MKKCQRELYSARVSCQRGPKGAKREPHGSQKGAKEEPKGAKRSPKGDKREPKGAKGESNCYASVENEDRGLLVETKSRVNKKKSAL